MKILNKIFIAITAILISLTGLTAEAGPYDHEFDPVLLNRMHSNPNDYIRAFGLGMGIVFYIEKSSINIEWSNQNETVVNANRVFYVYYPNENKKIVEDVGYFHNRPLRLAFNHVTHNVFKEEVDRSGNTTWKYIDSSNLDYKRGDGNDMCIAETIYYYAMKKPFYNPPLTYQVKELLAGRGETYLKMMNYVKSIQK